jgi:enoyl-CoA hydratase/carnithine racemase
MSGSVQSQAAPVRIDLEGGGVLQVTLARPEKRNALTWETFELLDEAFGRRAHQPEVRAVVLRGEGKGFCAGLDLGILGSIGDGDGGDTRGGGATIQAVLDRMEACPRPTLAVVHGACIGGGVALMLACDLRVASDDAVFAIREMRYAFLPDLGHLHRLQREVGPARAKEAVFFGEELSAATLQRWGVLNEVVPRDALDDCARRWQQRCAAAAPLAVAAAKQLMLRDPAGIDGAASQRGALEANTSRLLGSADFHEGLNAMMERRAPRFRGE